MSYVKFGKLPENSIHWNTLAILTASEHCAVFRLLWLSYPWQNHNMRPKPITLTQNCTVRFRAILMMMTNSEMSFVFKFSSLQVRKYQDFMHIWSCKHALSYPWQNHNMRPKTISTLTQNCTVRFRAILMMMTNTEMSFVFKFSSLQVQKYHNFMCIWCCKHAWHCILRSFR